VLFLNTPTRAPLGADTWIHTRLMRHLDRSTHEVFVACASGPAAAPTPTFRVVREIPDVEVVDVDLGAELSGATRRARLAALARVPINVGHVARLVWLVRRRRIEILHTSDRPRDAVVGVVVAALGGATSVVHVHVRYDPSWMGRTIRRGLRRANHLVAVSEFVGRSLLDGGHEAARVHVVPNGIEIADWRADSSGAQVRTDLCIGDDAIVITTICRLFPAKGVSELIAAVGAVVAAGVDAHLLVVGEPVDWVPTYPDELRAQGAAAGLETRLHLLGRRRDVVDVLAASDIYAMPSVNEPFGLVYAEAMAMRVPVVGLASGGTPEVIDDETTGLLVPPDDPAALADALAALARDPARRRRMGDAGRRRVAERFTAERMARDVADVYRVVRSADVRPAVPAEGGQTWVR
jgi:glycosyltransferase involved in cell wall biosynthesis